MGWMDNGMPPNNVLTEDMESRGVNADKWRLLAEQNPKLQQMIIQCYAKHNYGHRKFDEHLHQVGVSLRLNNHCEWLLQEYPELASRKE